jgi:hypothetical protein
VFGEDAVAHALMAAARATHANRTNKALKVPSGSTLTRNYVILSRQAKAGGIVVKPLPFVADGTRGLAQPAVKCRGRELGIEALERFVRHEPLRRVHECVFGVLALESEPVDPRL